MAKDYQEITQSLLGGMKELRGGIPDVMKAFNVLAKEATADGALDPKAKELIAVAIAIAVRCEGCIGFHVKAAIRHGATREEIMETIGMATYMGGGPAVMYGAEAIQAFDQFSREG